MSVDTRTGAGPTVAVQVRRWWRVRLASDLPRYLLCTLAVVGLLASARFAIAPPQPAVQPRMRAPATVDLAAEAYAALFVRRYLTWESSAPEADERALEPFLGPGMEPGAGRVPPPSGSERVEWVEVVQARELRPGEHVYTVAAQTDSAGLVYMTVGVARTAAAGLVLTGYPAFVGPPRTGPAEPAAHGGEVTDGALATVVTRALRNFLAASPGELAADLARGARVSVPTTALRLGSVERLDWVGDAVLATLQASDARGAEYTLAYELDVLRAQGRWEISAIQTSPET